jgi:transposase
LLLQVRRWYPKREIVAVADRAYASLKLLDQCRKLSNPNRRMSKDYERLAQSSEAFIYVAMSRLMARRLARS